MANAQPVLNFAVLRDGWGHITLDNVTLGGFPVPKTRNFLSPPPRTEILTGNPTGVATPDSIKGGGLSSQWNDYKVDLQGPDGGIVKMPVAQVLTSSPVKLNPGIDNITQADGTARKPWGDWFFAIFRALLNLGAATGSVRIDFEMPSIDENDSAWFFTSNADVDDSTDPLTFNVTEVGFSKFGRSLAVGDYLIWNDATASERGGLFQFEIDQITVLVPISGGYTITVQRRQVGGAGNTAAFGTFMNPHTAGRMLYRMVDKVFSVTFPINQGPQRYQLIWKNMCVAAVVGTPAGGPPVLINLQPEEGGGPT